MRYLQRLRVPGFAARSFRRKEQRTDFLTTATNHHPSFSGTCSSGSKRTQTRFLAFPSRRQLSTASSQHDADFYNQSSSFPPPVTLLTEDESLIQESVRSWANQDLKPLVRQMDDQKRIHPSIIQQLFSNGYMSLEIPPQYHENGSGLNFTSACVTIQEISRVDPSVGVMVDVHNTLAINAIKMWGSDFLKEKYMPKMASGTIAAFCLSEAGAGSDAFAMRTTAKLTNDGTGPGSGSSYTINGSKAWITNAREAGLLLVFCNTDLSLGYKGITAFLVDANAPGVHIGEPESKLGLKASSTCTVTFDNVQVSEDHVLGQVGQGYKYCIEILNEGRIGIAAQQIGIAKGCLDIVLPYLHEREQFNQKLAHMPVMQQQYAQAATELHAAEVMMYNACRLKENGMPFVKEAAMVKLYASQVAGNIASQSIEWMGGVGFTTDLMVEKFYRDCKVGSIYEGTSNMQRQTIARIINKDYE